VEHPPPKATAVTTLMAITRCGRGMPQPLDTAARRLDWGLLSFHTILKLRNLTTYFTRSTLHFALIK
jgi:hypothetical protein